MPANIILSIPHSFYPLIILKNPYSPKPIFHEFATIQNSVPLETPHPMILTACKP